jgi:membrane protein
MLRRLIWNALDAALAALAALYARRAAIRIWRVTTGEEPPAKRSRPARKSRRRTRPPVERLEGGKAGRNVGEPLPDGAPEPQPEHAEPRLSDPGLGDLSRSDWVAILKRTSKEAIDDSVPMIASALAYSAFLAIPSTLLVATGLFTLAASPDTISSLMQDLGRIAPEETVTLLNDSLQRLNDNPATGIVMTLVGFVIALWATTGAMTSFMSGVNIAYDRKDRRSFIRKRIVAVQMTACIAVAFLLVFGLLVLGPQLSKWVGDATGASGVVSAIWWAAQWPVLIGGLLAAFATLLYLGPDVDHPKWQFVTPGAVAAVVGWLAASGLFAVYTSMFGSYNKAWGSLAAVIIMLTWLWLSGLALLFGAELNAEVERSRELRQGKPAEVELQVSRER